MLDFREEIAKFRPVLGLEDVEQSVQSNEIRDIMDLLQYITKQFNTTPATEEVEPGGSSV